jgi:hypothetical protein
MKRQLTRKTSFCVCIFMVVFAPLAWPQDQSNAPPQAGSSSGKAQPKVEEPEANTNGGTEALQKATQNPVASLISVPVQNNTNFGQSPGYRTQDVLNIQPVIPIGISKDWNLLLRWIAPIVWQPVPNAPGAPETGEYGLGDMVPTFFISPRKPGKLIWGAGPVLLLATATNTFLGQGKLGIGPSVYNLKKGWFISWQPTLTANWEAAGGNQWTVPFGGGVGRIMKLGFQPVLLTAQFYGNAVHPTGTPSWTMRLQISFLFPKLSKEEQEMLMKKKLEQMEQQPQKD